jgi:hypothetical protein
MGTTLEARVNDALLALRWKRDGDGVSPRYFVAGPSDGVHLENHAASFLARFIVEHLAQSGDDRLNETSDSQLDGYSLEVIATYLEDHDYIVSLPS